jgi:hypothetical protein
MHPVLAGLIRDALWHDLFGARKAIEFIHLDGLSFDLRDKVMVSQDSLGTGSINPAMHRGRMHLFDARDRFIAQPFHDLMDGALYLLFRRLEVVEGRPLSVTEGAAAVAAAKNDAHAVSG